MIRRVCGIHLVYFPFKLEQVEVASQEAVIAEQADEAEGVYEELQDQVSFCVVRCSMFTFICPRYVSFGLK